MTELSQVWAVQESSEVGAARRAAAALAQRCGFETVPAGQLAIVVTELASNLVKHGGGGTLIARTLRLEGKVGIEVLSLDQGPGISEIARVLQDGYSTAGTAGNGLGAVRRLSSDFDLYSRPAGGTAVLATVWNGSPPPPAWDVGAVALPYPGLEVSGDSWAVREYLQGAWMMVVDGLGHGLAAHAAAESAERAFAGLVSRDPASGMMALHRLLRATRGAVAALAEVDLQAGRVRLAGVGNIHTVMVRPDGQRIFPNQNGTLGQQVPEPREFALPWPQGSALIMHSDGLRGSWNLARYPGLLHRRAALIAGVLYRDFVRGRDDATVVVLKEGGAR